MKQVTIALIISVFYLILGNLFAVCGMKSQSDCFCDYVVIEVLVAPYIFVGGMSYFAGWDWLSFVFETIIFAVSVPLFYVLLFVVKNARISLIARNNKKSI